MKSMFMLDSEYFQNDSPKFTLVKCPYKGLSCIQLIKKINRLLELSILYIENKEFEKALINKKAAFENTFLLDKSPCNSCGVFLRNLICDSTNEIVTELRGMTMGIFRRKKYLSQLQKAVSILNSMKKKV